MIDCEHVREVAAAYVLGAATEGEVSQIAAHLAACLPCGADIDSLRQVAALLPLATPQVAAPERLRMRVLAAAKDEVAEALLRQRPAGGPQAPAVAGRGPRVYVARPAVWFAAAAAAVIVAAGGVSMVATRQRDAAQHQVAQIRSQLDSLRSQGARLQQQVASGHAVMVAMASGKYWPMHGWSQYGDWKCAIVQPPRARSAMLLGTFPKIPRGKAYEVWIMRQGRLHSAGMVRTSGTVMIDMHMAVRNGDTIAFTLEPESGSSAPSMPLLMETTL